MRMKGKNAIVTGAGAGIGRATALRFAEEGARVMVAERDEGSGTPRRSSGSGRRGARPGSIARTSRTPRIGRAPWWIPRRRTSAR